MENDMICRVLISAAGGLVAALALAGAADAASSVKPTAAKASPAPKLAACTTIKVEADCGTRNDCKWIAATLNKKTKKEVAAQCKAAPKLVKKVVKKAA
jgi:hypothetical protein